jgi:hypothetical protein
MKPELDELVKNIAVSKKNTTAAIRRRTSASDKRSSSKVIGTGFVAVPIVLVILVVAADISLVIKTFDFDIHNTEKRLS